MVHHLNKSADLSGISLIQMLNRRNQSSVLGGKLSTGESIQASKRIKNDVQRDQAFLSLHRQHKA